MTTSSEERLGPFYELLGHPTYPENELATSDVMLFEAIHHLGLLFTIEQASSPQLVSRAEGELRVQSSVPLTWTAPSGRAIPLQGLLAAHAVLVNALTKRIGLAEDLAHEMGYRLQKIALTALGEDWEAYSDFLRAHMPNHEAGVTKGGMKAAVDALHQLITIDFAYDLDYVAGYAQQDPKKIYIDRDVPRHFSHEGNTYDTSRYLAVHEVVEKSLLDEVTFEERGYQRTHQIAQRLEEEAVRADNLPWKVYDDIMVQAITAAEKKGAETSNFPPDLDLTPYLDMQDPTAELVRQSWKYKRSLSLEIKGSEMLGDLATAHKLADGMYLISFDDSKRMALTMMRFQEYYESPKFRGTYFTREEYEQWYAAQHGTFSYAEDWGYGFNVPSEALTPFYNGHFNPLSTDERTVLDFFSDHRTVPFYLIATPKNGARDVLDHEVAHALYFLNPEYKSKVNAVLKSHDLTAVRTFLTTHPEFANYHETVLEDELHAYLGHSLHELKEHGFDIDQYANVAQKLKELYVSYAPHVRG